MDELNTIEKGENYPHHRESKRKVRASADALFEYLDDHDRLSGHMSQSSWMMAGSRMTVVYDADRGRAVGSHIALKGRALGIALSVEEVVTERTPPIRKIWETLGTPKLLVIGPYRMGFEIEPADGVSALCIFIDYALPEGRLSGWLGRALGHVYARWCTDQMAENAARGFSKDATGSA